MQLKVIQRLSGSRCLRNSLCEASTFANILTLDCGNLVMFHCIRTRLTIGSHIMSDLMLRTGLGFNPGEFRSPVASRVSLEEVVEITDRVFCTHTQ